MPQPEHFRRKKPEGSCLNCVNIKGEWNNGRYPGGTKVPTALQEA